MEAASRSAWQDRPPERNAAIESALASLIDVHGFTLFMQAGRLRRLLAEAAPGSDRHTAVLIVALSAEIPQRLRAAKSDATLPDSLRDAVQYLQQHAMLEAGWATWAVAVWANALQLPTTGLDLVIETPTPSPPKPPARKPAFETDPTASHGPVAERVVREPSMDARPRPARETDFRQSANDTDVGGDGVAPDVEPATPPILLEPLFPERVARSPHPRAAPPLVSRPPATATPDAAAPVAAPGGPRGSRVARSVLAGIALVATGLVIGSMMNARDWFGRSTGSPATTSDTSRPMPLVVLPAPQPAAPPTAVTAPPPAADADRSPVADAPVPTASAPVEPAADGGPAAASSTPAPDRPVAGRRPKIASIDVPHPVEGAPFSLTIRMAGEAADVASIERRVVDRSGAWSPTTTGSTMRRTGRRTLQIAFPGMDAPASATLALVAIGKDGSRGEPDRVSVVVGGGASAIRAEPPSGASIPCTDRTCGTVIAAKEISTVDGANGFVYDIAVRMGDGRVRSFAARYRLETGSHVRMNGDRFVPIGPRRP